MAWYANRQSARFERPGFVGSTPTRATPPCGVWRAVCRANGEEPCPARPSRTLLSAPQATASWSNGYDTWITTRKRWFDSIRGYCSVRRCCLESTPLWYGGRPGSTPGRTSRCPGASRLVSWGGTLAFARCVLTHGYQVTARPLARQGVF